MKSILAHKPAIQSYIQDYLAEDDQSIYGPVSYILDLGGKQLRPCLVMAAAKALGADLDQALPMAAAVEVFHNFTLLHDDIMDAADTRRGQQTVHLKWSTDQAILSGDIMFAMSYELLMRSDTPAIRAAHQLFTTTAKEVCIGQQLDMEFEKRDDVTEEEYIAMIRLKTSVLIGASMALGGLVADAPEESVAALYDYGLYIGLSFQMQDDILDAFGEQAAVGKRVGGDILQNKKTLLYLKAQEQGNATQCERLTYWYAQDIDSMDKVEEVKQLMRDTGALDYVQALQREYVDKAINALALLSLDTQYQAAFEELGHHQLERTF